ncbi:MAG: leucine-rich repeat domain-containing protein [[Clostridium] nexile]
MEKDFQKYEYKENDNKARITGAFWNSMAIEVPEKIDGFEVTEIGDYAFSQPIGDVVKLNFTTSPEEIILPNSIKKIGRYAFYNCRNLRRIQFYNTLKDIGAGAFTGCHKVRRLM